MKRRQTAYVCAEDMQKKSEYNELIISAKIDNPTDY